MSCAELNGIALFILKLGRQAKAKLRVAAASQFQRCAKPLQVGPIDLLNQRLLLDGIERMERPDVIGSALIGDHNLRAADGVRALACRSDLIGPIGSGNRSRRRKLYRRHGVVFQRLFRHRIADHRAVGKQRHVPKGPQPAAVGTLGQSNLLHHGAPLHQLCRNALRLLCDGQRSMIPLLFNGNVPAHRHRRRPQRRLCGYDDQQYHQYHQNGCRQSPLHIFPLIRSMPITQYAFLYRIYYTVNREFRQ